MLSHVEAIFVRILRGTVIFSAFISLLIAIGALIYAGYVQFAPQPSANLSSKIVRFREATNPSKLIKELFPSDSAVYREASSDDDNVPYELRNPTDVSIYEEFNKFLDGALGASFDNPKQFTNWLYGSNSIPFRWGESIDGKNARNENNVNVLWRSLIIDYAKRLTSRSASLGAARKQKLNPTAFDKMTAPTGAAQAPYFLVWFFDAVQRELLAVSAEVEGAREQRAALLLTLPIALYVAATAFGYFIFAMFLFLMVSIEASVRRIAADFSIAKQNE